MSRSTFPATTLAPSKSPLPGVVRDLLMELLDLRPVCIISGGQFEQFDKQVIAPDSPLIGRLHLMPTNGTRYDTYADGQWVVQHKHELSPESRARALEALEREARRLGLWEPQTWGPILEDRGSQITFSALGQAAPVDAKKAWDPDGSKRRHCGTPSTTYGSSCPVCAGELPSGGGVSKARLAG
ncbi:MAG: HAD family hydrolase [Propionibacteriaceae bacterium]